MASEAEIERLYQLFVAKGGGAGTFDNTNLTPKQYAEAVNASQLTPLQLAQLEAKQHQYNKQSALRSIADEIDANNFTNPYASRGVYSNSLFNGIGASTGVSKIADISSALSGKNFSTAETAALFAGVMVASGVDLEQILKIGGLMLLGTTMVSALTDHTNSQTANIPQTMADASSLASMNAQFGEKGDPCNEFNQLMGILAGIFDGTLDFIDETATAIHGFLKKTGVLDLLSSIWSAILGAGNVVGDVISAIVQALVGAGVALIKTLSPLVGKIINAIAVITSQIAEEIAGLIDMAAELIRKALALVLGSAATDPCQSAVLTNTGSLAMKDAVALLKHPMGTGAPGGIGTTVDDRANKDRVNQVMHHSYEKADLAQGVVQNPITESAKTYVAQDETLHSPLVVDGVLPYIPTGSTYAEMEVFAEQHWITVNGAWRYKQADLMYKLKAHGRIMETAYKTRDFTGPNYLSPLKKRLAVLIETNWAHQDKISVMLDNVALSFYYFVPGGKFDAKIEDDIMIRYETHLKPAMTRMYNDALSFHESSKIEWDSIDTQTF
jgi:hypothetical protein